ncbi:MAG: Sporulation killing factor maturation protein SkfB [Candidatus Anoxychlamydiales bacterium]|nr:Sporulation killing factor maturation protein SkfB [Candidatus Anoxychlamydiales bacterium]
MVIRHPKTDRFWYDSKYPISLQWHVTTNCSNYCKHCYMYDEETYADERKNTLVLDALVKILDDLDIFEKKYNAKFIPIEISGGDPLLRKDIFEFLSELKNRNKSFGILGNPDLLDKQNVKRLSELGIHHYQLSLDGLESTHDFFRSKGSFKRTIEKIRLLREYDIHCNLMFTLYPSNASDLIPLMRFVAMNTQATTFSFDIGVISGNAKSMKNHLTPTEIHKLFTQYHLEKKRLKEEGYPIFFREKSNFHKLINFENDLLYPLVPKNGNVLSGNYIAWNSLTLLSDGTALACRRMPVRVGKMPEQSFEKIFLGNNLLKKFRRPKNFKQCNTCDFYAMCRGCSSYVYGVTKDPFEKHPLCFRNLISKKTNENENIQEGPPLGTTYEEEWEYIYLFNQISKLSIFLKEKDFQYTYLDLAQDSKEFLANPFAYIKNTKRDLPHDQIAFLMQRFSDLHNTIRPNANTTDPIADYIANCILKGISQT